MEAVTPNISGSEFSTQCCGSSRCRGCLFCGIIAFFRLGAQAELLGFAGNAVGSLAVSVMGNKKSIDKPSAMEYIRELLR